MLVDIFLDVGEVLGVLGSPPDLFERPHRVSNLPREARRSDSVWIRVTCENRIGHPHRPAQTSTRAPHVATRAAGDATGASACRARSSARPAGSGLPRNPPPPALATRDGAAGGAPAAGSTACGVAASQARGPTVAACD